MNNQRETFYELHSSENVRSQLIVMKTHTPKPGTKATEKDDDINQTGESFL